MLKRTFGEVKTELARVAGQTGMQVTDPRLREIASLAQERLCVEGEWPYQYARIKFRQHGGIVSLPGEYEALVHSTLDREPLALQPAWFEFLEYGPGPTDRKQWANLGVDLGESPVFGQPCGGAAAWPGEGGLPLRVVSTSGDDAGVVVVTGYDPSGVHQVVEYALPETASAVRWAKIVRVTKPVTTGDVVLSYRDDFGEEHLAATYRPRETTPSFRQYRFPVGEGASALVHGIARRRVYPIKTDTDELLITNLAALRLAVKAVAFEDNGSLELSEAAFRLAAQILAKESALYRSGQHIVPASVPRLSALSARGDIY